MAPGGYRGDMTPSSNTPKRSFRDYAVIALLTVLLSVAMLAVGVGVVVGLVVLIGPGLTFGAILLFVIIWGAVKLARS